MKLFPSTDFLRTKTPCTIRSSCTMLLLPSRSFNLSSIYRSNSSPCNRLSHLRLKHNLKPSLLSLSNSSSPCSRPQHLFPKRSLRPKRLSMFSNNSLCSSPFKYSSSSSSLFNSRNTTFSPKLLPYQFNPPALHSSNKHRHHLLRSCIKRQFLSPPPSPSHMAYQAPVQQEQFGV